MRTEPNHLPAVNTPVKAAGQFFPAPLPLRQAARVAVRNQALDLRRAHTAAVLGGQWLIGVHQLRRTDQGILAR
jgi:hypothetical protein